ncbi:hypothetical protein NXY31_00135 [Bacteroides salyersiae]|nr:hypothetical protein [Bacteroides salyersiae]
MVGVNPANGDALYYTKDGKITNVYDSNDAVILDDKTPIRNILVRLEREWHTKVSN